MTSDTLSHAVTSHVTVEKFHASSRCHDGAMRQFALSFRHLHGFSLLTRPFVRRDRVTEDVTTSAFAIARAARLLAALPDFMPDLG